MCVEIITVYENNLDVRQQVVCVWWAVFLGWRGGFA